MHIKRLLSGSLAAMMVATSFNVPINVKAAEVPDTEPAAGLEENQELPSSDAEIPVDNDTNVVVEEPAEEPEVEVVTPEAEAPVEETTEEAPTEELVVEEESGGAVLRGEEDIPFTYIYDYNGGTASSADPPWKSNTSTIPGGESSTIIGLTNPSELETELTKDGYTLVGWSKSPGDNYSSLLTDSDSDADDGITVTVNKDDLVDGDSGKEITFYAVWQANAPATYTVTFNAGGGSGNMAAVTDATSPYPLPVCTFDPPTGKEFAGWLVDSDTTPKAAGTEITLTGHVTLTAAWATPAEKVTVTFDKNDGTSTTDTQEVDKDTETAIKEAVTGWTRDGYTLAGFAEDEDATSATITNGKVTASTAKTYYAVWTEWEKTITLNTNTKEASSITEDETWADANLVAWASQGLDAVGKSKFSAPKTIADLPTHIQAPNGYEFDKWMVAKQGGGYEEATNANLKPSSASDTAITLYASYKKLAASEIVDISADTVTITMDSLTYNGDDQIDSAKVIKSAIAASKDIKNYLEVKGGKVYSSYTSAEDNTEAVEVKNAGKYYVIVAPKSGFSRYTGEKKVEVTVSPRTITADDIIIDKKAGADENTVNREDSTSKIVSFNLFYNEDVISAVEDNPETEADESSPKKEKGTAGIAVEPKVEVKFNKAASGDAVLSEDVVDNFDIEYKKNDAVGTATIELTLKNDATNVTAAGTLTKDFTIVDGKDTTAWSEDTDDIKKAVLSDDSTKNVAGTQYGYGATYGKRVERVIPAIDVSTILPKGDQTSAELEFITVDRIYDTNGDWIASEEDSNASIFNADFVIQANSRKAIEKDDEEYGQFVVKASGYFYDGSYTVEYPFKDECEEHTWEKVVHPASFEKDGYFEYVCKECGAVAADDDKIIVDGKLVPVENETARTIPRLANTIASAKIYNKVAEDPIDDFNFESNPKVTFYGEPITIDDIVLTGNTNNANIAENVDGKANFTPELTGNTAIGEATLTITMADDYADGYYKGAVLEKKFDIVKDEAFVDAPRLLINGSSYSSTVKRGDKLELVSDTEGAQIYYQISTKTTTPGNSDPATDITSDTTKYAALISGGKVILYSDPIEVRKDVNVYTSDGYVRIRAFAVKNIDGKDVFSDPANLGEWYSNTQSEVRNVDLDASTDDWSYADNDDIPEGLWISDYSMKNQIGDVKTSSGLTYSGFAKVLDPGYKTPYARVFFGNKLLTYGTDYTISYKNNVHAYTAVPGDPDFNSAKAPTVVITGKGKYTGIKNQYFTINPYSVVYVYGTDVYDEVSVVSSIGTQPDSTTIVVAENGKIQQPKFNISYTQTQYGPKYITKTLKAGTDYDVDYSAIKAAPSDAGYPITITAKGDYTGTLNTRLLKVVSAGRDISKASVAIDTNGVTFDGALPQDDNVKYTVKLGDKQLVKDTDYTVDYAFQGAYSTYAQYKSVYSAGKYTVTITGQGDFCGKIVKTVNIKATGAKSIAAKTVSVIPSETEIQYDNYSTNKPTTIVVKDGNDTLKEDIDYVLGISNNNKVGTAKINVYGIGAYTGTKTATYKLVAKDLKKEATVTVSAAVDYTGYEQIPTITVKVPNYDDPEKEDVTLTRGTNSDYVVTYPKDMTNAGTKSIKITGVNGWKGSQTVTWTINTIDVPTTGWRPYYADNPLKVADGDSDCTVSYTNAAAVIYNPFGPYYYSNEKLGKDNFTFKITGEKGKGFKPGSTVTVKITGKKNFKKQTVTGTYVVGNASIANSISYVITDVQYKNAKTVKRPTITVTSLLTNKKLAAGEKKDYVVNYLTNDGNYTPVGAKEVLAENTEYIARITGTGNGYEGYKDVVFKVVPAAKDLSRASVTVNRKLTYDGIHAVTIDKDDLTVVLDKLVVASENFEIDSITNNNKVGTATVRIHGIGEFAGYKEVKLPIAKGNVNYSIQFKADRYGLEDGKLLTISGAQATLVNQKNSVFTLPTTSYKATVVTSKVEGKKTVYTTDTYALKYYYEAGKPDGTKYYPGNVIDIATLNYIEGTPLTLVAKFVKVEAKKSDTWTLKLDGNGQTSKTASKSVAIKVGATYKISAQGFAKTGYTLLGFATAKNATTPDYPLGTLVSNLADPGKDTTVYAIWQEAPKAYKVTYNLDGGTLLNNDGDKSYTEKADGALPTANPTKVGYAFKEWQIDNTKVTKIDKALKKNVTVKAVYNEVEKTLSYAINDGSGAAVVAESTKIKPSTKFEIKAAPTSTAANKDELTFLGWAKHDKAVKPEYKAGQKNVVFVTDDDITLYGVWKHTTYKITYALDATDKKAGAKFAVPGDKTYTTADATANAVSLGTATKPGCKFDGWLLNTETTAKSEADIITALKTAKKDVTLTPKFSENTAKATITLDTKVTGYNIIEAVTGDNPVAANTIILKEADGSVKLPEFADDKVPANKVFIGWSGATSEGLVFINPEGTLKYSVAAALTDSKLTAQFDDVVAEVSYDVNGGLIEDDTIYRTYSMSEGCDLPVNVKRAGYHFEGWKFTSDTADNPTIISAVTFANTDQKDADNNRVVKDTSVTAVWTALKSAVTYNKGTNASKVDSTKEAPKNFTFTIGASDNVTALDDGSNLQYAGYAFKGWAPSSIADPDEDDAVTISYVETKLKRATEDTPIILNAIWVPVTYKLTYAGLDDASFSDSEYELPKTWKATDGNPTLEQPTKVGATFAGWKIKIGSADASAAATNVTLSTTNITGDATITATWTALKKTTLKFDANAPTGAEAIGKMDDITIYKGSSAKVPANAFKVPGYKFTGWKNGDTPVAVDSDFAATATDEDNAVTLKAQWTGITNTIQYNKNDGTGIIADKSQTFTFKASPEDSDKKELEVLSGTATEEFVGWALKRTATGAIYAPITDESDTNNGKIMAFIQPSYDGQVVTLYAVWQPKNHVTVKYDANGGTGTMADTPMYATGVALSPNKFTRTGYTFQGWATTASGTKAYDDGATNLLSEAPTSITEKTLYAVWTKDTYTITFQKTDGTEMGTEDWAAEYDVPVSYDVESSAKTLPVKTNLSAALQETVGTGTMSWHLVTGENVAEDATASIATGTTGNLVFKMKITPAE